MTSKFLLNVTQVNTYIKSLLDGDFTLRNVYVQGEISNFKNHTASGHYYFSLKDDSSTISAAMFKRENARLKFTPYNGMRVIARGRIAVYEKSGSYSLYVDELQPDGVGALWLAYEQLKEKLEATGIFDPEHKRALPSYPSRVGVITSGTGAAVQDIINVLGRRYPLAEVILLPVKVQGEGAAQELIAALQRCNDEKLADVIIIGRGGGSIEDLWAFNDEALAYEIYNSQIPVISAVGHETDFTIADFAADLRAPTPSAAAELAVPDASAMQEGLAAIKIQMRSSLRNRAQSERYRLEALKALPALAHPMYSIQNKQLYLDTLRQKIDSAASNTLKSKQTQLGLLLSKAESLNPMAVLNRGYSIAYIGGKSLSSIKEARPEDELRLRLSDGNLYCTVRKSESI